MLSRRGRTPHALHAHHQQRPRHQDPILQVPYDQLLLTKPCSRVTDGSNVPLGQVRLLVTFGKRNNYQTELVKFYVTHIGLLYNAILGYPALAKFMAATHHGYNVLKLPGTEGVITVSCDKKDVVCSLERAYQAASVENSNDEGAIWRPKDVPKKKKQLLLKDRQEAGAPDDRASGPAPIAGAPSPLA